MDPIDTPSTQQSDSTAPVVAEPAATKKDRDAVSPLVRPSKAVIDGFRALFSGDDGGVQPAREWVAGREGSGLEAPVLDAPSTASHLERAFAFVDVCGFTSYVDRHGTHAAIEILTRFRSATRDVAARRGVRVAKWLGDGVMLVGAEAGPTVAAAAELVARFHDSGIDIHVGLAKGHVLLFEGDDYIGRPVNLAARLCDAAEPGEVLALVSADDVPPWVSVDGQVTVRISGIGDVAGVKQLVADDDVLQQFRRTHAA